MFRFYKWKNWQTGDDNIASQVTIPSAERMKFHKKWKTRNHNVANLSSKELARQLKSWNFCIKQALLILSEINPLVLDVFKIDPVVMRCHIKVFLEVPRGTCLFTFQGTVSQERAGRGVWIKSKPWPLTTKHSSLSQKMHLGFALKVKVWKRGKSSAAHLFHRWWLESGGSRCHLCCCQAGSAPRPPPATPPWRSPSPSPPWPGPGLLAPPLRPSPELVPVWWQVGWTGTWERQEGAKPQTWCATGAGAPACTLTPLPVRCCYLS